MTSRVLLVTLVLSLGHGTVAGSGEEGSAAKKHPHVVLLVLDEFPGDSLLGKGGRIDPVRYPNFAALAGDATWFRNAYSVYDSTTKAVPLILDGRRPQPRSEADTRYHPESIFTALARRGYRTVSREEATAIRKTIDLGDDAVAAFDAEADQVAAAFAEPGAFERTIPHPSGMDMPGARLLGFRIGDYALHAWDLAQAIGADEKLDDNLVQEVWNALTPLARVIGKSGVYGAGPTGQVDDTAPLQERLLDLTGRTR